MMLTSIVELAREIENDPMGLGYAPHLAAGSDSTLADILNAHTPPMTDVWRSLVPAREIVSCLVPDEVRTLSATDISLLSAVLGAGALDATSQNTRDLLFGLFPSETCPLTNKNITTVLTKPFPSRAEALWGEGTIISSLDVARALGRA